LTYCHPIACFIYKLGNTSSNWCQWDSCFSKYYKCTEPCILILTRGDLFSTWVRECRSKLQNFTREILARYESGKRIATYSLYFLEWNITNCDRVFTHEPFMGSWVKRVSLCIKWAILWNHELPKMQRDKDEVMKEGIDCNRFCPAYPCLLQLRR
jgi:hypothetical protein